MDVFEASRNGEGRSGEAGDCGPRSHGGGVCGSMFFGDRIFSVGDVGVEMSSEEVKMGDRMAKNEGDGVKGVRGESGQKLGEGGGGNRDDVGAMDESSIKTILLNRWP